MKNYKSLNEEIDNIKHLLSYKKGSVLSEDDHTNEQFRVDRDGDDVNISSEINIKVKLKQLKQGLMTAIGGLVGAGIYAAIDKKSISVFIDEVVEALNTTFADNPEKLKNLIPHFSTLEGEIKKVIKNNKNVRDTEQMEESIKSALISFVEGPGRYKGGTKKTEEKYSITDEEINTFRQKLEGIKLTNKKEIKETKMRIRKNGKVVNLTESDLRRIVKRVLKEQSGDPTQRHRYRDGSNPGVEEFLDDPTNRTIQDRLKNQLNNDIYSNVTNPTNIGKGTRKLFIYFNGRKQTVEQFVDQVQRDGEDGFCHNIELYEYDNRALGHTKITIKTKTVECDTKEPVVDVEDTEDVENIEVVDDNDRKKGCPDDIGWRNRVLEIGYEEGDFNWRKVIPLMGSSKESICKCFSKNRDRRMIEFCQRDKSLTGRTLTTN